MKKSLISRVFLVLGGLLAACASPGEVPSPVAPIQVAACLTFVIDDERPPIEEEYDRRIRADVRAAVEEELVRAGFTVVVNETYPHDLVARLSTEPGSAVATGAEVRSRLALAGEAGRVAELEAAAPQTSPDYARRVAKRLVDGVFRAPEIGAFARDMRRPDVEQVGARLRAEHAAMVDAALTAPAAEPAPAAVAEPPAQPAEPPKEAPMMRGAPHPEAYALIVGVERYASGKQATGARADAERFAELAKVTLGVPANQVSLALDDHARKADIDAYLSFLRLQLPRDARLYFYFSGLGATERAHGSTYFLPHDADPGSLEKSALRLNVVLRALGDTKAREVIAIFDAGTAGTGARSTVAAGLQAPVKARDEDVPPHVVLLSAAASGEIAGVSPGRSEGLLSRYLVEGMGQARADIDGDGEVTLAELQAWARPRVTRDAKRDHAVQRPGLGLGDDTTLPARLVLARGLATP